MRRTSMDRWKSILMSLKTVNPEQKPGRVTLGTRRAIVTFLLIMGTAVLLVAAISKILH